MYLIYQIGIRMLYLIILLASPFSSRASRWISGRKANRNPVNLWQPDPERRTLWMHVSSLGEFEQGRPVLEFWKEQFPGDRILVSFFSPSGFDIRKNYPVADLIFYLPLDTYHKMDELVSRIRPDLFILVRYDFWPNLLKVLMKRKISSFLISARFSPGHYFFKRWGRFFLRQLEVFKLIFVQDEESSALLKKSGLVRVIVAGDTRVDAVMGAEGRRQLAVGSRQLADMRRVVMGGSTWPAEEKMLARLWKSKDFSAMKENWGMVIAPHDISEKHLSDIEKLFDGKMVRLSSVQEPIADALRHHPLILVDSIGLLSSLYAYADLAVIGGGFGRGIHNILEPAAFGIPIVFGPRWSGFGEAVSLIRLGAATPVSGFDQFSAVVNRLCSDPEFRLKSGNLALSYMNGQMGSTALIIRHLLENC